MRNLLKKILVHVLCVTVFLASSAFVVYADPITQDEYEQNVVVSEEIMPEDQTGLFFDAELTEETIEEEKLSEEFVSEEELTSENVPEEAAEKAAEEAAELSEEQAPADDSSDRELISLYDRNDGLVVFSATRHLMKEPDEAEITLNAVMYTPSPQGSQNAISGIRINCPVRWTGMDAWWENGNGQITFSDDWSRFYASGISELKAGDVIEWKDDKVYGGLYTNHIAIVTHVASDGSCFTTADGNAGGYTGVRFITHYDLTKGNSSCGTVNIWRNAKKAGMITSSVKRFAQKIIEEGDTAMSDYFWGSLGINWCYCFVVEALLQVNDGGALYEKPILHECKNTAEGILISWDAVDCAEGYRVYVLDETTGSWTRLADTKSPKYHFTKAKKGHKYVFTAAAFGENGFSKKDKTGVTGLFLEGTAVKAKKGTRAVKLTWKEVTKAKGYKVYRCTDGVHWKKIADTKELAYKDTQYVAGAENRYLVRAYVTRNKKDYLGYMNKKTLAAGVMIPNVPEMSSVQCAKGALTVCWKAVDNAACYFVYRKSAGTGWAKIVETTGRSFQDKQIKAGVKYIYSVSAVASGKAESDRYAKRMAGLYVPMCRMLKITSTDAGLLLKWRKIGCADGYKIYRRTPGGKWKRIKTVGKVTSFEDKKGTTGTVYEYLVRAYKSMNEKQIACCYDDSCLMKGTFPKTEAAKEIVIMLDPGHDSTHAGCARGSFYEHEMTMEIAMACKAQLETYRNVKVLLTRATSSCPYPYSSDTGEDIMQRVKKAVDNKADAYISLHINAAGGRQRGVMIIPQVPTWKKDLSSKSLSIGESIKKELRKLGLGDNGVYYRYATTGEKYPDGSDVDYYAVTYYGKYYGIPSLIMEHGYIDNDDFYFMNSSAKLEKLGIADAKGIAAYYGLEKK